MSQHPINLTMLQWALNNWLYVMAWRNHKKRKALAKDRYFLKYKNTRRGCVNSSSYLRSINVVLNVFKVQWSGVKRNIIRHKIHCFHDTMACWGPESKGASLHQSNSPWQGKSRVNIILINGKICQQPLWQSWHGVITSVCTFLTLQYDFKSFILDSNLAFQQNHLIRQSVSSRNLLGWVKFELNYGQCS